MRQKKTRHLVVLFFTNGRIKKEFWFVGEALPFLSRLGVDAEPFCFDDDFKSHFFCFEPIRRLKTRFVEADPSLIFSYHLLGKKQTGCWLVSPASVSGRGYLA